MEVFIAGIAASVIASLLVTAAFSFARSRRVGRDRGSAGVWVEAIYNMDDLGFEGDIQRLDVVRQAEGFSGRRVAGTIYRVYDRARSGGINGVRSYRVRGRTSEGQEVAYFWSTAGDGSDGTLLLVHSSRDEMAGEYLRKSLRGAGLPLERFPVRRVRLSSGRLADLLVSGQVQTDRIREVPDWPQWVKDASNTIRSAR